MKEFFITNFLEVMKYFNLYYSNSKYFVIFLFAIVLNFIILKKENKKEKVILVWLPIVVLIIIMNPIVFKYLNKLIGEGMGNTYWRVFWLLPLAPVIGYSFTKLIEFKQGKVAKFFIIVSLVVIIISSGKLVYNSTNFKKVANWYKIPDNILTVILASRDLDLDNKKVMCPVSVIPWVRQVDSGLKIEYGRPVLIVPRMVEDYGNGYIKNYMKKFMDDRCNIMILQKNVMYDVNIEDYGYELFFDNGEYLAYKIDY